MPIVTLAIKDLRLLSRDPANCFFTFVFPLLLAVFFGFIFGGGGEGGSGTIDVAIVDLANSKSSKVFADDLSKDSALSVRSAASEADGEALVRAGKVQACIVIPADFDTGLANVFAGQGISLTAIIDPARSASAGLLTGKLNEYGFRQLAQVFSDPGAMDTSLSTARETIQKNPDISLPQKLLFGAMFDSVKALTNTFPEPSPSTDDAPNTTNPSAPGWSPISVTTRELQIDRRGPRSSFEISFPQGVVWGLLGCVMTFGPSLAEERSRGTLMRLTTAPISRGQILAGKALACFTSCLLVQGMLVAFAILVFRARFNDSVMTLVAMVACGVGFTGIMMLMAGLARTEGAAQGYGRAIVLILAMIGGGTIPVFFMPAIMKTLSGVSPFKWAVDAIEGGMWRGFTPSQMALPVGVLLGVGLLGFLVGTSAMRWSER